MPSDERPAQRLSLIFDGGRGFCTWLVLLAERPNRNRRVTAMPYRKPGVPASADLALEERRSVA